MKSLGSIGSFLWALVLVLLALIYTGNGFKQELWFYDAEDNAIQFHSQVADLSDFSSFLPKVTRRCTRGLWMVFSSANFTSFSVFGSVSDSSIICRNFTAAASVKSLRHWGANDTDTDALSLYEGINLTGKEIFVSSRAYTGITNEINGITATGTSAWMLFEGQALDGKSLCFKVPRSGWYFNSDYVSSLNLTTIGSVFKGCDLQEIQNYKILYPSNFVHSD